MHVSVILQDKGSAVVTAGTGVPLREIIGLLEENRIGAVVITGASQVIEGIVSERDVVHALAISGPEALDRPAGEVMSREVVTCAPQSTVESLMPVMTERRVRHIPVTIDGALAGVVSIGDVVKSRISVLEHETEALHSYITNPY